MPRHPKMCPSISAKTAHTPAYGSRITKYLAFNALARSRGPRADHILHPSSVKGISTRLTPLRCVQAVSHEPPDEQRACACWCKLAAVHACSAVKLIDCKHNKPFRSRVQEIYFALVHD